MLKNNINSSEQSATIINIVNISDYEEGTSNYQYKNVIINAKEKWESVITSVPNNLVLNITVLITESLGENILGGATLEKVYDLNNSNNIIDFGANIDGKVMGTIIPAQGKLELARQYFNDLENTIYSDGNNGLYITILHEIGHLLGILGISYFCFKYNVIGYDNQNFDRYVNNNEYYSLFNPNISNSDFGGSSAVREYNNIFNSDVSVKWNLIPVENNGGSGTHHFHAEEGDEGDVSSNNRYLDGIDLDGSETRLYPGLDKELMTGWADGVTGNNNYILPLSKITIGFLEDIGYSVDYSKADYYNPPLRLEAQANNRLVGDVNNNGNVTIADVVFLSSYLANLEPQVSAAQNDRYFMYAADTNNDGQINIADVIYLSSFLANIPDYQLN